MISNFSLARRRCVSDASHNHGEHLCGSEIVKYCCLPREVNSSCIFIVISCVRDNLSRKWNHQRQSDSEIFHGKSNAARERVDSSDKMKITKIRPYKCHKCCLFRKFSMKTWLKVAMVSIKMFIKANVIEWKCWKIEIFVIFAEFVQKHEILCDGKKFFVTKNFAKLLRGG